MTTDPDAYVTEEPVHPAHRKMEASDPVAVEDQQAHRYKEMAEATLLNLQGARQQAEQQIADIQRRVDLDQQGAEALGPLQAEVAEARKVEQQLQKYIVKLDQQIEQLHEEMMKQDGGTGSSGSDADLQGGSG